ncbi:hypothetical protein [Corynebacterium frankenforstense]
MPRKILSALTALAALGIWVVIMHLTVARVLMWSSVPLGFFTAASAIPALRQASRRTSSGVVSLIAGLVVSASAVSFITAPPTAINIAGLAGMVLGGIALAVAAFLPEHRGTPAGEASGAAGGDATGGN